MITDTKTEAPAIQLDDYVPLLGQAEVDEIRTLASKLTGRTVQMVNSTAMGGGVAEILNRLTPLMQELQLNIRWDVITGGGRFFEIKKSVHTDIHGALIAERQ